jgi:hypothetical protein
LSGRELTDAEVERLLTQEEVDALAVGTVVCVKWSGGNGPHRYKISGHNGIHALVDNVYRDPLRFVGKERCHTRVFLPEEESCSPG